MQIWQALLALGMLALFAIVFLGVAVASFFLVRGGSRATAAAGAVDLDQLLGPLLASGQLRATDDLSGLHVRGTLEGLEVHLTYRKRGMVGLARHPYDGISLLTLRVCAPGATPAQVERGRSTLRQIAAEFGGAGMVFGAVRVNGSWLEWYNPKREPQGEIVNVIRRLAQALRS